eukprot:Hpha_TRINITY_DN15744_c3_g1::TRINITY_DN15744_c3_g1_i2::g.37140::m.37140
MASFHKEAVDDDRLKLPPLGGSAGVQKKPPQPPRPPAAPPNSRAPRARETGGQAKPSPPPTAPGSGRAPMRTRLTDLQRHGVHAATELLRYQEGQRRVHNEGEEAWSRELLGMKQRKTYRKDVIEPQLLALCASEPAPRRDVRRKEVVDRTRYENLREEIGEKIVTLGAKRQGLEQLEKVQRIATTENWRERLHARVDPFRVRAKELAAEERIRQKHEQQRLKQLRRKSMPMTMVTPLGEAEYAARLAVSGEEHKQFEYYFGGRHGGIHGIYSAEAADRKCVCASADASLSKVLTAAESDTRLRTSLLEEAARHAAFCVLSCGASRLKHLTQPEVAASIVSLQRWVRAISSGACGRTATRKKVQAEVSRHRHRVLADKTQAAVKHEHRRAMESLRRAQAAAAADELAEKILRLDLAERKARRVVVEDDDWTRIRLRRAHCFEIAEEVIAGLLVTVDTEQEPAARNAIAEELERAEEQLRTHDTCVRGRLHDRDEVRRGEFMCRQEQESDERVFRVEAQHRDRVERKAILDAEAAREAAIRLERELELQRQAKERAGVEHSDAVRRAAITASEGTGRVQIEEARVRFETWRVQMVVRLAMLVPAVEAMVAATHLWEDAERVHVYESSERSGRMQLEYLLDDARGHAFSDLRKGLRAYRKKLEGRMLQIVRLQDWARRVSGRRVGRTASRIWIRRELGRLWEERKVRLARLAGQQVVQQHRDKLRNAEEELVTARVERQRDVLLTIETRAERALSDSISEERWVRESLVWHFKNDMEQILAREISGTQVQQDHFRAAYLVLEMEQWERIGRAKVRGYLSARVQPIQRCARCMLARKARRRRVAECLSETEGVTQDRQRLRVETFANLDRTVLEAEHSASATNIDEVYARRELVFTEARMMRGASEARMYRGLSKFCLDAAESGRRALRIDEERELEHLQVFGGTAVQSLQISLAESAARRRMLQEVFYFWMDVTQDLETAARGVVASDIIYPLHRLREVELGEALARVIVGQSFDNAQRGRGTLEEEYWRSVVEGLHTRGYRALFVQLREFEGREVVAAREEQFRTWVQSDEEYDERALIESKRGQLVRGLYQQRLEGLQRHRLRGEESRNILAIATEAEQSARIVEYHIEAQERKRLQLAHLESCDRVGVEGLRWLDAIPLVVEEEYAVRAPMEAQILQSLADEFSAIDANIRAFAEGQEDAGRGVVSQGEEKWRRRVVEAEGALRKHILIIPVQRAARARLRREATAGLAKQVLHRHQLHVNAVLDPEGQERIALHEHEARLQRTVDEEAARSVLKSEELDKLKVASNRFDLREEQVRTVGRETQARKVLVVSEAGKRNEAVFDLAVDCRVPLRVEEAEWRTQCCMSGAEERRPLVEAEEQDRRDELCGMMYVQAVYLQVAAQEPAEREHLMAEEDRIRTAILDHERWLRESRAKLEEEESEVRQHIIRQQRAARKLFNELEMGRRLQVDTVLQSAIRIQNAWRRYYAVCAVEALQALRVEALVIQEAEARDEAASKVQSMWMGYAVRGSGLTDLLRMERDERCNAVERAELENEAARVIQRSLLKRLWWEPRTRAALQAAQQLRDRRAAMLDMRDSAEALNHSARTIQALWRMHSVRKNFAELAFAGDWV